jgi:aromatic-amino-acid transaminase
MELTVRRNYSSPPAHGARLVASILLDRELKSLWQSELGMMRDRVKSMRKELHSVLRSERPNMNFDHLLTQRGMFSYTGLSADRVKDLRTCFGIYLVESGRLCLTGLNTQNVQRVGRALAQVMPSFY